MNRHTRATYRCFNLFKFQNLVYIENGNGSNECGFSGLPDSLRYDDGQFNDIGRGGYWWSTTPNAMGTLSYTLNLSNSYMGWGQGNANETYGFAVRCIKD